MLYSSTRGQVKNLLFEDAVMMGLADDGGLLVPNELPFVETNLDKWRNMSFTELSIEIMLLFTSGRIPRDELISMVKHSYSSFHHPEITPVNLVGNLHVLELFHGPTFAFKDVALQFLGNLFAYFLKNRNHPLRILGATSGDTGSAAIHGLRCKKGVDVFMLFPKGKVSEIQELQMTTVLDSNIHNIAIEGSFDEAQGIVKSIFNDQNFKQTFHLGSVNSINWARILAQIVYYFYAFFRVNMHRKEPVSFVVPTGNFGNVLAGYYAKKMGLPIDKLIVGTNENDILHRFFSRGEYHSKKVRETLSPSMDIQISSNFERYLYELAEKSSDQLNLWMNAFEESGRLNVESNLHKKAEHDFSSARVNDEETLSIIRKIYHDHKYLLDPHSAVGVCAAKKIDLKTPVICLACAHPAKFSKAIRKALGIGPILPYELESLKNKETHCNTVKADPEAIKKVMLDILEV